MTEAYDLYDPDGYVAGPPHEVFTRLRPRSPSRGRTCPDEPGYWAVLRHADVVRVAREPELFSAATGGVVLEDLPPESLAMMQDMLLAMDPPRHLSYRRNVVTGVHAEGDRPPRAPHPADLPHDPRRRGRAPSTSSTMSAPSCHPRWWAS